MAYSLLMKASYYLILQTYHCTIFFSAELLANETIEYNDLVDLLHGETSISSDKQNETLENINDGAAPENGNLFY